MYKGGVEKLRKVTVPEDMSSEQKVLLGVLSIRQLIYIIIGGAILGNYIPYLTKWLFGIAWPVGIIGTVISALPVIAVVFVLGFYKQKKYHMFYDMYLLTRFKAKSQYGIWRKGEYTE